MTQITVTIQMELRATKWYFADALRKKLRQ